MTAATFVVVLTCPTSILPTGIKGGPPAAARVSLKVASELSVPFTTAMAPELLIVTDEILATSVDALAIAMSTPADTDVKTPAR